MSVTSGPVQQGGEIVHVAWDAAQLTCNPQPGDGGVGFFVADAFGALLTCGVVPGSQLVSIDNDDVSNTTFEVISQILESRLGQFPVSLDFRTPFASQTYSIPPPATTFAEEPPQFGQRSIWAEPSASQRAWGEDTKQPHESLVPHHPISQDRRVPHFPLHRPPREPAFLGSAVGGFVAPPERPVRRLHESSRADSRHLHRGHRRRHPHRHSYDFPIESHPRFTHMFDMLRMKPAQSEFGSRDFCWFLLRTRRSVDWQIGLIVKRVHDQYVIRPLENRRTNPWVTVFSHEIAELPPPEFLTAAKLEEALTTFVIETHGELILNSEIFEGGRVRVRLPVGHGSSETNVMAKVSHIHRNGQCQVDYRKRAYLATPAHLRNVPEAHQDMYRKAEQARTYLKKYHDLKRKFSELEASGGRYDYEIPETYVKELQRLKDEIIVVLQYEDGVSDVSARSVHHSQESPEASVASVRDQIAALGEAQRTLLRRYEMLAQQLEALVAQTARTATTRAGRTLRLLPGAESFPTSSVELEVAHDVIEIHTEVFICVGMDVHTQFGVGKVLEIREDDIHVVQLPIGMGYLNKSALTPLQQFLAQSQMQQREIHTLRHECAILRSLEAQTPSDAFASEMTHLSISPPPNEQVVREWLRQKNLSQCAESLVSNGFDHLEHVAMISEEDCSVLLNLKIGHARRLIFEIQKLKNEGANSFETEHRRIAAQLRPHQIA